MAAATARALVSVRDYLARERVSPFKHEYDEGVVYAMAATNAPHSIIAVNASTALHVRLRGKRCRVFNSDMKIRIQRGETPRQPGQRLKRGKFYYPDLSVVCGPIRPGHFQDNPSVILEILSESTRHVDEGKKKEAYLTIPTLRVYLLAEQDRPLVTVYRRRRGRFEMEIYEGLDAVIPLPEIGAELPLSELCEGTEAAS